MRRKLVQAGGSLAVTLPAEVVKEYDLEKGMSVEVTVHPKTGAITVRPGIRYAEDGKITERFDRALDEQLDRRADLYRKLAE